MGQEQNRRTTSVQAPSFDAFAPNFTVTGQHSPGLLSAYAGAPGLELTHHSAAARQSAFGHPIQVVTPSCWSGSSTLWPGAGRALPTGATGSPEGPRWDQLRWQGPVMSPPRLLPGGPGRGPPWPLWIPVLAPAPGGGAPQTFVLTLTPVLGWRAHRRYCLFSGPGWLGDHHSVARPHRQTVWILKALGRPRVPVCWVLLLGLPGLPANQLGQQRGRSAASSVPHSRGLAGIPGLCGKKCQRESASGLVGARDTATGSALGLLMSSGEGTPRYRGCCPGAERRPGAGLPKRARHNLVPLNENLERLVSYRSGSGGCRRRPDGRAVGTGPCGGWGSLT